MNYSEIVKTLLSDFPEMKTEVYDNPHLQDLPHCIFDLIVEPYVVKACENGQTDFLQRIAYFFEKMATCSDKRVVELLNVSVLEPLVLEENSAILTLQTFFGDATQKEFEYWKKRYGKEDKDRGPISEPLK